jgi:hypothetical protein
VFPLPLSKEQVSPCKYFLSPTNSFANLGSSHPPWPHVAIGSCASCASWRSPSSFSVERPSRARLSGLRPALECSRFGSSAPRPLPRARKLWLRPTFRISSKPLPTWQRFALDCLPSGPPWRQFAKAKRPLLRSCCLPW